MAIVVKVYNKPKTYFPSTMTETELAWIIDYCDSSAREILSQLEANDLDLNNGLLGRGESWVKRSEDARNRYINAMLEFKEYLGGGKRKETEYNDVFVTVSRELLDPDLFARIADATQDRMTC